MNKSTHLLIAACVLLAFTSAFAQKQASETIQLTSFEPSDAEAFRMVRGGKFAMGGWQAVDSMDYILIELKDGIAYNESGAIELDMTNLDPTTQTMGRKHHFFSLYANPEGSHFSDVYTRDMKEDEKQRMPLPFVSLRFGEKRYTDDNGQGIKVLWRPNEKRFEHAPFGARSDWSKDKTYTWRMAIDRNHLTVYLNGDKIFGPEDLGDRDKNAPLKYIYLSKDGNPKPTVWFGFPGPVYKELRVYDK
jgi:hypothetical protein